MANKSAPCCCGMMPATKRDCLEYKRYQYLFFGALIFKESDLLGDVSDTFRMEPYSLYNMLGSVINLFEVLGERIAWAISPW